MSAWNVSEHFTDKAWLEETSAKLNQKMKFAVAKARETGFIPYTTEGGEWKENWICWWTNGFWPGTMWQMYLMTGDDLYREEALRTEKMLDAALPQFRHMNHDVGFMWLIHSGLHYALENDIDSFDRTMIAANLLAGRFNPNGFIRAWNGKEQAGWAIVDCMMNLPLLYWASEVTGDPRYRLIAMRHADTTLSAFMRPDGSCNHIVIFDPDTGAILDNPAGQGYASGSSWSRGQAWALYGFTLNYMYSGKPAYLDAAKRVANYFIANIQDDFLPRCDFRQPAQPEVKDDAAAACAASGLLELCRQVPECEAKPYYDAAEKILRALEARHADWSERTPALLTHCTVAYHEVEGRHITMTYADFFFVEALNKLRGETRLAWMPNR